MGRIVFYELKKRILDFVNESIEKQTRTGEWQQLARNTDFIDGIAGLRLQVLRLTDELNKEEIFTLYLIFELIDAIINDLSLYCNIEALRSHSKT